MNETASARFVRSEIMSLVAEKARYELGESYGRSLSLSELIAAGDGAVLEDIKLDYGSVPGEARLRRLIAERHGVAADEVLVTVGGAHALFLCAFVLCEKGDDAVSTVPAFPPARATLDAVGASVHELRLRFENAYQPDLGEFSQQLSERTRVVSIASPQNPSGVLFSTRILNEMLEIMNDRCPDAYLLVDETYREAAYGSNFVTETACGLSPKIISIASLSKCHGVPGLRIGWAITRDSQLRKQLLLGKFNSVISCSPLDEALAFNVLQHSERIMKDRRLSLDAGLSRTASWVYENGLYLKWVRPDAGAICAVRLEPAVFDDAAVRRFYDEVTRNGVRIASGTWFGDEARVFRLGFGLLPKPDYEAALEVLSAALRRSSRDPGRRAS